MKKWYAQLDSNQRPLDPESVASLPHHACYGVPVIKAYSEHRLGDGEKRIALWLAGTPILAIGLERWPRVGDRFEIAGEFWHVVEITDRVLCDRGAS